MHDIYADKAVESFDVKVFLSEVYERPVSVPEMAKTAFLKPYEVKKMWSLCYRCGFTNRPGVDVIRWTAERNDHLFVWLHTDVSYLEAMELDAAGCRLAALDYLERMGRIPYLSDFLD